MNKTLHQHWCMEFLQLPYSNETDHAFKAAAWTLENKNGIVHYYFEVDFNF